MNSLLCVVSQIQSIFRVFFSSDLASQNSWFSCFDNPNPDISLAFVSQQTSIWADVNSKSVGGNVSWGEVQPFEWFQVLAHEEEGIGRLTWHWRYTRWRSYANSSPNRWWKRTVVAHEEECIGRLTWHWRCTRWRSYANSNPSGWWKRSIVATTLRTIQLVYWIRYSGRYSTRTQL